MKIEEIEIEGDCEVSGTDTANSKDFEPKKKKRKKLPIIIGVIALVLIAAGFGFFSWHEQPSFCNAICHTPMDPYNETYDLEAGSSGVDKWGNQVQDTNAMLCVSHKVPVQEGGADAKCLTCHVPTIGEQISEGVKWISGDY